MVSIPGLEINSQPVALLGSPENASFLEIQSLCRKQGGCATQFLVALVDVLSGGE